MPADILSVNNSAVFMAAVFGAERLGPPNVMPIPLDFTVSDNWLLNLDNQQGRGLINGVQTIYVDNSRSDIPVVIRFPGTQQTINANGRTQGYYTALCPNPINAVFSAPGGGLVTVILMNYPTATSIWSATN